MNNSGNQNQTEGFFQKVSQWVRESIMLKLVLIGVLVLILQIPGFMIKDLIKERKYENQDVQREIAGKWGGEQNIAGPIISIPFYWKTDTHKVHVKRVHLLPEDLNITGNVDVETKYRGIYNTPVFKSSLAYNGSFDLKELKRKLGDKVDFQWNDASISIGVPDMRGIQEKVIVDALGEKIDMNPGVASHDVLNAGVSNTIKLNNEISKFQFKYALNVNGSERLAFYPIGRETNVAIKSNWEHPSFNGSFLPDTHQVFNTDQKGFDASWKILNLNRNYPQFWVAKTHSISNSDFGVEFKVLADHYQKTTRSSKYSNMFIFLTFLIFFFIEVITKVRIHPIQYLLVGIGLTIFYTLLLSISEHYDFRLAYFASSIAIVSLITTYIHAVFKRWKSTIVLLMSLIGLYVFLFVTLQLESYALLIGSIGVFVILAAVMFASRKVKWSKE